MGALNSTTRRRKELLNAKAPGREDAKIIFKSRGEFLVRCIEELPFVWKNTIPAKIHPWLLF
jgi:hypothetical protein